MMKPEHTASALPLERRLHMASLRDTVKDYQEELRDGIAWVAFWKMGRSWNAEYFHLEMGDYLYPEDRSRMEEIKQADPAAVVGKRVLFRLSWRG